MSAVELTGCDEYGNGCGCKHCVTEDEARRRFAAEWDAAMSREDDGAAPGPGSGETKDG